MEENLFGFSNVNKVNRSYDVVGANLLKFYHKPEKSLYQSEDLITITEEEGGFDDFETIQQTICDKSVKFLTKSTQTDYRESDAQTDPWDPPFNIVSFKKEPNVLSLRNFSYGNGLPASMLEVNYIKDTFKNRNLIEKLNENEQGGDNMKKIINDQKKTEWNYRVAIETQMQLKKLEIMTSSVVDELKRKSEKREKILKNMWNKKKNEIGLRNIQLGKKLDREIRSMEHQLLGSKQDSMEQSISKSTKKSDPKSSRSDGINEENAGFLLSNYFLSNTEELSTVKDWLEKKQTILKSRVPIPKLSRKTNREKLTEKAYEDLLFKKRTKLPPKVYHDDYESEKVELPSMRLEDPVDYLQVEEEKIDMVTVWQQILRGLAYQKQMLKLVEKHKDGISRLLFEKVEDDV